MNRLLSTGPPTPHPILACAQTLLNLLCPPPWTYVILNSVTFPNVLQKSETLRVWPFISADQVVTEIIFQFANVFALKYMSL